MAEQSFKDLAYRTTAGVFGGPVDLASMVMRPFGYDTPDDQVIGGSEWIGKKMEDQGLVSSARAPLSEFLSSIAVPSPGGLAKGLAVAGGMFIGKGAKIWDAISAAKAKDLEKMGKTAREIWKETGTWKGPDGKWRQEIDDSGAKFNNPDAIKSNAVIEQARINELKQNSRDISKGLKTQPDLFPSRLKEANAEQRAVANAAQRELDRVFGAKQHPRAGNFAPIAYENEAFFDAYPDAKKIVIRQGESMGGAAGSYDGKEWVDVYKDATGPNWNPRSTASHELQHYVQQQEGFAKGGNPRQFWEDVISERNQMRDKMERLEFKIRLGEKNPNLSADKKKLAEFSAQWEKMGYGSIDEASFKKYKKIAGEAEARATQARLGLSKAQRRDTFPPESYDTDINDLIIQGVSVD